jgi:ethanolamine utilization protein EutA
LLLTEPLVRGPAPTAFTFSGGVSEYIFKHEVAEYGDIAPLLASELATELSRRTSLPFIDPGQRIRATVIGASQFTVQVSGKTVFLSDPEMLPVHNVPVVSIGPAVEGDADAWVRAIRNGCKQLDLDVRSRLAIGFPWRSDPDYPSLAAAGRAIIEAVAPEGRREEPLFLMIDGDVGRTLGQLMHRELNLACPLVSIDGVQLQDLDYVDVGRLLTPPGVVPIVIKSLLFS